MAEIGHKPDTSGTSGQATRMPTASWSRGPERSSPSCASAPPRTEELRRLPPETERDSARNRSVPGPAAQTRRWVGAGLCRAGRLRRRAGPGGCFRGMEFRQSGEPSLDARRCSTRERRMRSGMQDADALIASSFIFPAGRARKVDGGYVLSGHWPFSSGVESCEWNMLASVVASDDEADGMEYRIFLLNRTRLQDQRHLERNRPVRDRIERGRRSRTPLSRKRCRSP